MKKIVIWWVFSAVRVIERGLSNNQDHMNQPVSNVTLPIQSRKCTGTFIWFPFIAEFDSIILRHLQALWSEHNWLEQKGRTRTDRRTNTQSTDQIRRKICQNEKQNYFFSSLVWFSGLGCWREKECFFSLHYSFLINSSFIVTPLPWLSDVLFGTVLIFSFGWLHCDISFNSWKREDNS